MAREVLTLWAIPDTSADSIALLAATRPAPGGYKCGACHALRLTPYIPRPSRDLADSSEHAFLLTLRGFPAPPLHSSSLPLIFV